MSTTQTSISRSAWARLCRVLSHHPLFRPFRIQRNRRLLVIGYILVLAAMPLVGWLTDQVWAVLVLFIPFALGGILLGGANQGLLDRPIHRLDERERQLRQTIFSDGFSVGATAGLLSGMVAMVAFDQSDALMMGLLVAALSGLFLLPAMVLAWRMPDEVDDEA